MPYKCWSVGQLKRRLANLPDDWWVVVGGHEVVSEYDYYPEWPCEYVDTKYGARCLVLSGTYKIDSDKIEDRVNFVAVSYPELSDD